MAVPREKLVSLSQMTVPELQDLLRRQEKLLTKKGFVNHLPDKGAKIHDTIERVQEALRNQDAIDHTTNLFHRMALDANGVRTTPEQSDDSEMFRAIMNRPDTSLQLQQSYVRVIKGKPEKEACSKERFRPNSLKRVSEYQQATQQSACHRVMDSSANTPNRKLKHRYDDSLEETMHNGPNVHESAVMIGVQESVELMSAQKKKQEEYQNKQAMERLGQRLNIKVGSFDPEGSRKMAYRDQDNFDSDDDLEDEKLQDYGREPSSPPKGAR